MSNVLLALLCIVASLLLYIYYKLKKIYETWSNRGIPHEKPIFLFGNSLKVFLMMMSPSERQKEICDKFPNEPFVGYYDFLSPLLMVKDSEMVEKIVIKDFQYFLNRGFEVDETKNPLDVTLFNMTGKRWKALRNKISPIFTTGKLRKMHEQMVAIGMNLDKLIEKENMKGLEVREIMGRFAMDVIGSVAFGFDAGNLENPDSEFRRMGKRSFEFDIWLMLRFILLMNFPWLAKKLGIGMGRKDVQDYFVKIIRDSVDYRRKNGLKRNDFLDLMIQLKDKGTVEITTKEPGDEYLGIDENYITDSFELTEDLIVGNSFVFLTAGFEATALSLTWALFEISQDEKIQGRLREEISKKTKEHGGFHFDAVKDMEYLEMVMKETLRKYPPAQGIFRKCNKEYTFPGGLTVYEGDSIMVPFLSIHHCPDYFPEPEKFIPERFAPGESLKPCTFLPFGDGPRMCIAMRFAMQQIKFGIAKILMNYDVRLSSKTTLPVKINPRSFFTEPTNKLYFDLEKI